ncbi:MAG: cobalamin-dependent protein, partial [Thermoplasmata archaeon]
MRILVTNPPWPGPGYGARSSVRWPHRRKDKYLEYPIHLAYVISILKEEGFDSYFLDGVEEEMEISSYVKAVREMAPELIFMEASTASIEHDLESARGLKEALPAARIVLMGPHATYFHREILDDNPAVDAVCRGEFESTAREIANALRQGRGLSTIAGVSYREGNSVSENAEKTETDDIDSFPYPDRQIVRIEKYQQGSFLGKRTATLISSNGCPFSCVFCLWPKTLYHGKRRERRPECIVREMEDVVERYGADEIYFDDDCLALSKKRLVDICGPMARSLRRVNWIAQIR